MCQNATPQTGFTLFEILVVMVLISLVTALTIPKIRTNLFSDQLKSTARRLVGLVIEVSQDAVSNQSETVLNFDLEQGKVWSAPGKGTNVLEEEEARGKSLEIPESVRIVDVASVYGGKSSQGTAALYFSKKGYVDKTAIHLRSDDGDDMTIVLSPFMGAVRIFDSYVNLEDDQGRY